jgi:hypothetical protein
VSRNSSRSERPDQTCLEAADQDNSADSAIIEQALALYGSQAATAVAFCALDAWFEGEDSEYRRMAGIFQRLRN